MKFYIVLFSFGFAFVPSAPGFHSIEIPTWKVAANNYFDSLKIKFHTGGLTVSKSDLVYSGVERYYDVAYPYIFSDGLIFFHHFDRYKLSTISSGKVTLELMIIPKNFSTFGVDLKL